MGVDGRPQSATGQATILTGKNVPAMIGMGRQARMVNLKTLLNIDDVQVVAVCDVDRWRTDNAKNDVDDFYENRDCRSYTDWREVIARSDVDAVMISTPDHWHVPLSLAALRSGKDVICEKPTLTIAEGRVLTDTVQRYGAVFQMSTEDRSVEIYHRMAELVRNDRIGKLEKVYVQLPAGPGHPGDPRPKPVPEGLDWELWLGPAPWKPYRDGLHQFHWRWHRDYSGGQLTDWGAHQLDTVQLANDTERTGPIEVEGTGVIPTTES